MRGNFSDRMRRALKQESLLQVGGAGRLLKVIFWVRLWRRLCK